MFCFRDPVIEALNLIHYLYWLINCFSILCILRCILTIENIIAIHKILFQYRWTECDWVYRKQKDNNKKVTTGFKNKIVLLCFWLTTANMNRIIRGVIDTKRKLNYWSEKNIFTLKWLVTESFFNKSMLFDTVPFERPAFFGKLIGTYITCML